MNASRLIAAALVAAMLPFVPGCTTTTAGRADINATEWLEDYDAKAAVSEAARPTTTSADPAPRLSADYSVLVAETNSAAAGIKSFWARQGIDLDAVKINAVDDPTRAPCPPLEGDETDGWACGGRESINVYLPLLRERVDVGGSGYVWFVVGHELGHLVDARQPTPAPKAYVESLADCLAGAAAAGVGMPDTVLKATDAIFPSSTKRHNAVKYGITNGYRACINGAK